VPDLRDKSLDDVLFRHRYGNDIDSRAGKAEIVRRFDALTQERDGAVRAEVVMGRRLDAAEHQLTEATKERDVAKVGESRQRVRAVAAEAEVARLREALTGMLNYYAMDRGCGEDSCTYGENHPVSIARAALARVEGQDAKEGNDE
jgi:hypothetical protein